MDLTQYTSAEEIHRVSMEHMLEDDPRIRRYMNGLMAHILDCAYKGDVSCTIALSKDSPAAKSFESVFNGISADELPCDCAVIKLKLRALGYVVRIAGAEPCEMSISW